MDRLPLQQMTRIGSFLQYLLTLGLLLSLTGCVSMATERMAASLSNAMLNQTDPEIVRSGAPAYLLLLDSFIEDDPEDQAMLYAGARLYGAYAGGMVDDPIRKASLMEKALDYAQRGLCPKAADLCAARTQPFDHFSDTLQSQPKEEIQGIYLYATSWAGWIQTHADDWNAVAELPKVEALLRWVVARDPAYEQGRAQLYLGIIGSQVPPTLGGNPEIGRKHFEAAIDYSQGHDLIAKVEFARHYARLVFDQTLHDRLLNEVVEANPVYPGLTLSNVMAQQQATRLLQENYF